MPLIERLPAMADTEIFVTKTQAFRSCDMAPPLFSHARGVSPAPAGTGDGVSA
ncbi:hypothetical protein GJ744_008384 [Endocarpon pusillum]|uniref:Uncharacterized protein n=1 Tax=Endocarpon pusillum TaxID=364733 RepID=A0A8H7E4K6_9EURO|nr:hypothetical protein GJ744_008384 [Endocarpon pusillum]